MIDHKNIYPPHLPRKEEYSGIKEIIGIVASLTVFTILMWTIMFGLLVEPPIPTITAEQIHQHTKNLLEAQNRNTINEMEQRAKK